MKRTVLFIMAVLCLTGSRIAAAKTALSVNFTHDGLIVHARLQLPDGNGPYRTIIIDPGSGPNDKDGTLVMSGGNILCLYPGLNGDTIRSYKGLSDAFSDSGYAVLTYDKLEYTYTNLGTITFHKLWLPVESAIAYLKTRTDIDTANLILLGHSEGSSLIPYIARTHPEVKILISLAGPRTPFDSILAYQVRYIAQTCGQDTNQANLQAVQVLQYYDAVRSGNWNSSTPAAFGVPAAVWSDYLKVTDSVAVNYNLAARNTLFVGLGSDINVPVATELHRFQNEVTVPADFYEIPGLVHYLCTPSDPAVSQTLTDTIVYWLRKKMPSLGVGYIQGRTNNCNVVIQNRSIAVSGAGNMLKQAVIYDMQGRVVYSMQTAEPVFSFSAGDVPAGIYLLQIATAGKRDAYKIVLQ